MLAVLNSDRHTDDARKLLQTYRDFEVGFIRQDRGLKVSLKNAPAEAFVDGKMIRGTRELLFAVLRDIVFTRNEVIDSGRFDLMASDGITNAVFHIARNARLLNLPAKVNLAVCWGGHAISREEYDYSKQVGYELGLRGLNVCTGCGPGAMKGPMKGATIGHAKQRIRDGRYVGITEPGIIAAESPNPIVNSLVIMPDMEKRLEAFVRVGHGIIVFPGGVGTAEEILYLLGVLLNPDNEGQPFPLIMTGPASAEPYFRKIDEFVVATLGPAAQRCYEIIIERLKIDENFQRPFAATHEAMRQLKIDESLATHELAANLRRVFSGIVSGNVREDTAEVIERKGPFEIAGSRRIMSLLDDLLSMKISRNDYAPCYVIK
jgi:predicted Rossmann-fold nucleotide-binding protein